MKRNDFLKTIKKAIITGILLCLVLLVYPQSKLKSKESLKSGSETIRFPSRENLPWDEQSAENKEYMDRRWKGHTLVLRTTNAKQVEQSMAGGFGNAENLGTASREIMTYLEKYYTNCGTDVKFDVYGESADIIDISPDLYADDATQGLAEATDFLNTANTEGSDLDQILDNYAASHGISREDVFPLLYVANNQGSTPGGGAYTNNYGHGFALSTEATLQGETFRKTVGPHELSKMQNKEGTDLDSYNPRNGYIYKVPTNPDGSLKYDFREDPNGPIVTEVATMSLALQEGRRLVPVASGQPIELLDWNSESWIPLRMGDEDHNAWKYGNWPRLDYYFRESNVGVEDPEKMNDKMKVYPNPSNGPVYIEGFSPNKSVHIRLINITGSLIYDKTFTPFEHNGQRIEPNLPRDLARGVYIFSIEEEGSKPISKKFVK